MAGALPDSPGGPRVSVLVTTYNHERFIAQAINSVLMQEVDFDYEVIIGDDCSTDATRAIVLDFQQRYPERIRLVLPHENLGFGRNRLFVELLNITGGQYIAGLDGDDYWTRPDKLATQVAFLDVHPACSFCFHNALITYEDPSQDRQLVHPHGWKSSSSLVDVLSGNFIPAHSVLFRRALLDPLPAWFGTVRFGDWALWILLAQHGKIGHVDEVWSMFERRTIQPMWPVCRGSRNMNRGDAGRMGLVRSSNSRRRSHRRFS
jgi:glycosyltransferase involved in cell wall biosynthesis